MIFCTKCGQQNDDAARSCVNCGSPFNERGGTTPFATANPTTDTGSQAGPGTPWGTPSYAADPAYMQARGGGSGGMMTPGEKRDPIMALILSLLTCGIYAIYWVYMTSTEIKNALRTDEVNPVLDVVLTIITCGIWGIYLAYKYPQFILQLQDRVGQPRNDISLVSLILAIVGLAPVSLFMVQTELNKVWDAAGRR